MAKISAYKVVNPGSFSGVSPQVASVRKSTYAINRLGATISSMGSVVKDLESIEAARVTNNKLAEQAERRRLQREADEAAETQAEINNLSKKGFKSNIKRFKQLIKFQLSFEQFRKLSNYSKKIGITFFSTPFDIESAKFLNNIQKVFKI